MKSGWLGLPEASGLKCQSTVAEGTAATPCNRDRAQFFEALLRTSVFVAHGGTKCVHFSPHCAQDLMEVKVEVYSLISSAKRYSSNFTQLFTGHRTCSFISHPNSPGSIQPGRHFRRTELFQHTSLRYPTR